MTTIDTTEIKYDRITKDFAIYVDGKIIGYGRNYSEAEQKRTAYLAEQVSEVSPTARMAAIWGQDATTQPGGAGSVTERMARIWSE